MLSICVCLRRANIISCTAHLTGNFREHFLRKQPGLRSQVNGATNRVRAYTASSPLLSNYRRHTDCFRISSPVSSVPHLPPGRTQCGHPIHTSASVRALPAPVVWLLLKPLQKLAAVIVGRSLRGWWLALPANRRELFRQWVRQHRWNLAAGVVAAVVIVSLFVLTHLDEAPVTGRTRLLVFSRENYIDLAAITSEMYLLEFKELLVPVNDPRHQVVEKLTQHLSQRNKDIPEVSEVTWNVHVVDSPVINAFCLPNGDIFVFTGMLNTVVDVHQLAVIIGHEMAHAVLGHSAEKASLSHIMDLMSVIVLTAIWAVCSQDSLALLGHWVQQKLSQLIFSHPYSRTLEAEADHVGLLMAAKACADVRAASVFWQQMEIRDQLSGTASSPQWLSTHPSHTNRVNQLDRLVPQALQLRDSCNCPALPATDPRAVFSKSAHMLLENAAQTDRGGRRGGQGAPPSLTSLPAKMPAALLAPDALLPPSQGDQGGRVASIGAPDSAAAAAAADASAAVVGPASTQEPTVQS